MYSSYKGPTKLQIAKSQIPGAGYGVRAKSHIRAGELLEVCPFIEVPTQLVFNQIPNLLQHYVFRSHCKPGHVLVVFGYGSMFNHSKTRPNVYYRVNGYDRNRFLDFVALENIPAGTELCTNYGPKHSANRKN